MSLGVAVAWPFGLLDSATGPSLILQLCLFDSSNSDSQIRETISSLPFLPRDALLARHMRYAVIVSVRSSVTSRCSTKKVKARIKQTTPLDNPGNLVW